MKKINFKIVDFILLSIVFFILYIYKNDIFYIFENGKDTTILSAGFSLLFLLVCIVRLFFRPSYEEVVELKKRGIKVSGFNSKRSLSDKNIYEKSYRLWVKINLVIAFINLMLLIVFCYGFKLSMNRQITIAHGCLFILQQICTYFYVYFKEKHY